MVYNAVRGKEIKSRVPTISDFQDCRMCMEPVQDTLVYLCVTVSNHDNFLLFSLQGCYVGILKITLPIPVWMLVITVHQPLLVGLTT